LPAGTVTATVDKLPEIDAVHQPYDSTGGKPAEDRAAFELRTAERLRHKNRALTAWDYERLVLAHFPVLHKAKCILPTHEPFGPAPGSLYLVAIPQLRATDAATLRPPQMLPETTRQVADFLAERVSPFVKLTVRDPEQIALQVVCRVNFKAGYDRAIYTRRLNADLRDYIYAWMFEGDDIPLGAAVENSRVVHFINGLAYIDYVLEVAFRQSARGKTFDPNGPLRFNPEPPHAYAAWVSVAEHDITIAETAAGTGLNYMRIEGDFVVGGQAESRLGIGFWVIGESFQVWDSPTGTRTRTDVQYFTLKK
ncbi:MAG: baseplate J/gp47 family protein, partial [Bacteroidota bacterium]